MEYDSPLGKLTWSSAQQIETQLAPGEHVRWVGQPNIPSKGVWLFLLLAIGLAWFGWIVQELSELMPILLQDPVPPAAVQKETLYQLFGLGAQFVILCVVLYVVWTVCRTVYVITDRRAMICLLAPLPGGGIRSFFPDELQSRRVRRHPNGTGHILLDGARKLRDDDDFPPSVSFLAVPEVNTVEGLLQRLAENGREKLPLY